MSTPYLDEAERCAHIALLHEGKVLALDRPEHLRAQLPGTLFEVMVDEPRAAVARLSGQSAVASAQVFGDRLHVWVEERDPAIAEQRLRGAAGDAAITPTHIRHIVPSLEDVFIARIS